MALYLVTGVMGGGKSYLGADVCLTAFEEGAVVHTNMQLNEETIAENGWQDQHIKLPADPSEWQSVIHAGEEGKENLLMVDEAALCFHVNDQQKKRGDNRDIFELLVWSRKAGLDVYFITQSAANIDVMLRRLTEIRVHCVAVKMIPFVGWLARPLLGDFKRMRYGGGEGKNLIGSTYHRFSQRIGDFYRTDDTVGRSLGLKKTASRGAKKNKDKRTALMVLAFLVLAVVVGVWQVKGIFSAARKEEKNLNASIGSGAGSTTAPVPADFSGKPALAPVLPRDTVTYHVEGVEWNVRLEDDLIISAHDKTRQRVFCRDGVLLEIGASYRGENLVALVEVGGRFYATTKTGRRLIARPWTTQERKTWIQSSQISQAPFSGSSPLPVSLGQGLSSLLGR
ncbi:zonular occludens toxin domain-containing protein [Verrucomicrobium sp. BvORR034]|uniref:zonular occludens toxin domain-containing protein n=1 Tax=Verrucomicrobium sp. BvORR034 TaxID=1396418 RepID=UPI000678B232|nr:zonular occludens toxin domain-containing protein [Verrucomicrobium sp. BvORR034]